MKINKNKSFIFLSIIFFSLALPVNAFETQADINISAYDEYAKSHKKYERIVERLKQVEVEGADFPKIINTYLSGYEKRKEEMINLIYPGEDKRMLYGSLYPTRLSILLQSFDQLELNTYKMILRNVCIIDSWACTEKGMMNIFEEE